jgi:hypothetical protein
MVMAPPNTNARRFDERGRMHGSHVDRAETMQRAALRAAADRLGPAIDASASARTGVRS